MRQDQVDPLLEEGRDRVPVEGVLLDHHVVPGDELLLSLHIHIELGIELVQVPQRDALHVRHPLEKTGVNPGGLE